MLVSASWWYASPQDPNIPPQERPQGPESNYYPGGAGCQPWNIYALPVAKRSAETDRCAQAYEEHQIEQGNLNQQVRLADLAEGNLRLVARQVRGAYVQTVAVVAAFIAAVFAAYYAKRAADEASRSATAAHAGARQTWRANKLLAEQHAAEQRPWVAFDHKLTSHLTWDEYGEGHFSFTFFLRNTGPTPALNVWIEPEIVLNDSNPDRRQAVLAKEAAARTDRFGFAIFPGGEPRQYDLEMIITKSQLADVSGKWKKSEGVPLTMFTSYVIGTIAYRGPDRATYNTGFILSFYRTKADGSGGAFSMDPTHGDVNITELRLAVSPVFVPGVS